MDSYKEFVSRITVSEGVKGYYPGTYFFHNDPSTTAEEAVKAHNRTFRQIIARGFKYSCTFDSVLKTCVRSGFATSWIDKSYAITWVAVHSMDDSICVVTRHHLDMARVGQFYKTLQKHNGMYALTDAIVSEVEGLPYDDDFRERSGLIIKKPFGVVSVFPAAKESNEEEAGQLASSVQYDEEKAINFLREKMKNESEVITLDDAIKTSISAFKHLCLQELEAEEYWVTAFIGHGYAERLLVPTIEKHLADINSGSGNADSSRSGSTNNKIEEHFPASNIIGSGIGGLTNNENVISI